MLPTMSYELAMAASRDAANAQMRKAGRKAWDINDYNLSVEVFNRCWPMYETDQDGEL